MRKPLQKLLLESKHGLYGERGSGKIVGKSPCTLHSRFWSRNYGLIVFYIQQSGFMIPLTSSRAFAKIRAVIIAIRGASIHCLEVLL